MCLADSLSVLPRFYCEIPYTSGSLLSMVHGSWRDSSVVKSTFCSHRGPGFGSQFLYQATHNHLRVQEICCSLLTTTCTKQHVVHVYTYIHTCRLLTRAHEIIKTCRQIFKKTRLWWTDILHLFIHSSVMEFSHFWGIMNRLLWRFVYKFKNIYVFNFSGT